MSQSIIIVVNN